MYAGVALGAALLLTSVRAQDKKVDGSTVSVTGCLAQGREQNEYALKDASGKNYGLRAGSDVNLKAHIGHKVTITGTRLPEKNEPAKTGKGEESEHIRVSNLSMVSTSCT
jgi:hypothetical protein